MAMMARLTVVEKKISESLPDKLHLSCR